MARIAGVTVHKTRSGKIDKITLSVRRWGHIVEDVLDRIAVERNKNKPEVDWEDIKKSLDKKSSSKK